MKHVRWFVAVMAVLIMPAAVRAQRPLPKDVPADHWAAQSVRTMLDTGIMSAPGDVFAGNRKVTRNELVLILARFARVLEEGKWPAGRAPILPDKAPAAGWKTQQVSRYVAAAVVARMGAYAVAGLPAKPAAKPQDSEAIPPAPKYDAAHVAASVKPDLKYLVDHRLIWPGSPLLKPGPQLVTGQQLADAIAQVITGVNGRMTEEPPEEPEAPPPSGVKSSAPVLLHPR